MRAVNVEVVVDPHVHHVVVVVVQIVLDVIAVVAATHYYILKNLQKNIK